MPFQGQTASNQPAHASSCAPEEELRVGFLDAKVKVDVDFGGADVRVEKHEHGEFGGRKLTASLIGTDSAHFTCACRYQFRTAMSNRIGLAGKHSMLMLGI